MENENQFVIQFTPRFQDYIPTARICQLPLFRFLDKVFSVFFLGLGIWVWVIFNGFHWWILGLIILAVSSWFNGFRIATLWLQMKLNPLYRQKITVTIDEAGIKYKSTSLEQSMEWSFYNNYFNLEHVVCLMYGRCNCSVIPKRAFKSQDDIKHFQKLLKTKIGTK